MPKHHGNARAHVIIEGHVQGVFFRDSTRRKANEHGIRGYIKNLPDGTVEAVFEGSEESVRNLISWCNEGPPSARVESIDVTWQKTTNEFSEFSVRY